MKVHLPMPRPRLAFLGHAAFELHVPASADWAEVRFFPVGTGWKGSMEEAAAWAPTHSIVFAPTGLEPHFLTALPGMKIAVLPTPMTGTSIEALDCLCQPRLAGGFRWVTSPDAQRAADGKGLPFLQSLLLPVDMARFTRGPQASVRHVMVPSWAQPAPNVLKKLKRLATVEILPEASDVSRAVGDLDRTGVLVYAATGLLGRFDPFPLFALASGNLVIASTPFPADWNIEPEDEVLVRPEQSMVTTLEEVLQSPVIYEAVRIRAWQKMRECFDASAVFKRLLHDAQLFSDLPGHLSHLAHCGKP